MTKPHNSNFDKLKDSNSEKLKKFNFEKVYKNSNCKKISKTQKLEFGLKSNKSFAKLKTQILMKLTYSYCDKTQKL